jgi:hypothetical protein
MRRRVVLVLPLVLGIGACGKEPVAPVRMAAEQTVPSLQAQAKGTGLVVESLTGIKFLGTDLGDLVIDQAVVKEFGLIEDVLGNIVGLEATGVVSLTGGLLGTDVVTEDFSASVGILNSGSGQCEVITVDPAPLTVDALGRTVAIDVPVGNVGVKGSGAVGNLLCAVGRLLTPVTSGASRAVQSLVDAVNRLLI